jgi:hypothetical protein
VTEQLESLKQTCTLGFSPLSTKNDSNIQTVYLHEDDFYFEVPIGPNGEILDVKFAMFNEPLQVTSAD